MEHPRPPFLLAWLPFFIVISMVAGLGYVLVQQDLRQGANQPQVQLAEDAAAALQSGATESAVISPVSVNLEKSLAPFVVVYDRNGKVVAGNGLLNGKTPTPPSGVLTDTPATGDSRLTWQPQSGVRIAAVVVRYQNPSGDFRGYVLAGRSLREIERQESYTSNVTAVAWLLACVLTLGSVWVARRFRPHAE